MEEQLITWETAKLAKEKGFHQYEGVYFFDKEGKEIIDYYKQNYNKASLLTSRPTQALLQRWLREVHHIHLVCWWYDKENKFYTELGIKGIETIRVQTGNITNLFETYETALEAGLQEALKLIK